MKKTYLALIILVLCLLAYRWSPKKTSGVGSSMHSCPPGYYHMEGPTTWAGWQYNCLPIGNSSSLLAVSEDTQMTRAGTIYAPIIAGTGPPPSLGQPAE